MKSSITQIVKAAGAAGCLMLATAQDAGSTSATEKPATTAPAKAETPTTSPEVSIPAVPKNANPDEIRLNFKNAPLDLVLEYLSEAAGFVIVLDAPVKGTVNVVSSKPMNREEVVDLLNTILNKNGLAAVLDGRILTIVDRAVAKTRDIPVKVGNDPNAIPKNDQVITQIIPIRYVEAEQLVKDLGSFISPQATFVANAAGNSILMTDTQANIRHMLQIIKAIDSSAESGTEIRVFHLNHASPADVASALSGVFPSSSGSGSGNNQSPVRFGGGAGFPGGFGGFPGGGFGGFGGGRGGGGRGGGGGGGGGNNASSASSDRIKKASQVLAVADARTSSVIVTASRDLMGQIDEVIKELDVPAIRDQQVYMFRMTNGDPQQAVQVLQNMFQSSGTSRSGVGTSSQNSPLMQRQQNNTSSSATSNGGSSSFGGSGNRSGGGQLF